MIYETFIKSGVLTLAGMAVVFAFMLCMMLMVTGLIRFSARFFPDGGKNEADGGVSAKIAGNDQDAVIAAIAGGIRSRK